MALTLLPQPPHGARLAPVRQRYAPLFCFALLTASCALASFALACATPFAAFAVVAAAMLPLPTALLVVTGAWLVNQAIGFGVLHYPIDANTILWGFAIGIAALVVTAIPAAVLRALRHFHTQLALAVALIAAYGAYELALLAVTPFLGGTGAFTAAIMIRLGAISAFWLIGLVAACEIVRLLDPARRGQVAS